MKVIMTSEFFLPVVLSACYNHLQVFHCCSDDTGKIIWQFHGLSFHDELESCKNPRPTCNTSLS